jgi:FkbM family methyltransferase
MLGPLIFDVGAHMGEDTDFYLRKGFSVVAIEAVPKFCNDLKARFSEYVAQDRLLVVNMAVSNVGGTVEFYLDEKNSVWGTMNLDWVLRNRAIGGGNGRVIKVPSSSLRSIMREYGVPHYCKIDIEGNDLDALKSLQANEELPAFISIESEKRDWNRLVEEFMTLSALGYTRFKIVDQTLVHFQKCPQPAREGIDCHFNFEMGSSGLFGDELPGKWLDLFEALEMYKSIFRGYALNGDNGLFSGKKSLFNVLGQTQAMAARLKGRRAYVNPASLLPSAGWYDTHAAKG